MLHSNSQKRKIHNIRQKNQFFHFEFFKMSFLMSFLTDSKYFFLIVSLTKGTDQNCLVFVNKDNLHPKTNVYTPITSLSFTEFTYNVNIGKEGDP